jgi:hypothetical protein
MRPVRCASTMRASRRAGQSRLAAAAASLCPATSTHWPLAMALTRAEGGGTSAGVTCQSIPRSVTSKSSLSVATLIAGTEAGGSLNVMLAAPIPRRATPMFNPPAAAVIASFAVSSASTLRRAIVRIPSSVTYAHRGGAAAISRTPETSSKCDGSSPGGVSGTGTIPSAPAARTAFSNVASARTPLTRCNRSEGTHFPPAIVPIPTEPSTVASATWPSRRIAAAEIGGAEKTSNFSSLVMRRRP